MWLIRSVSMAICPSMEPVLAARPPKSAKILAFFSVVKYDISLFLTSLLNFFFISGAKVDKKIDIRRGISFFPQIPSPGILLVNPVSGSPANPST